MIYLNKKNNVIKYLTFKRFNFFIKIDVGA